MLLGRDIAANGFKVTGLGAPTAASNDAARKVDLEAGITTAEARANHTGTQLAATISDFDTQVRTSRLDQMSAPTAAVSFNSNRITSVADPTSAQDAATKNYVDGLVNGFDWKASVRVVATTNGTLSTAYANGSVVDGVTLATGNRILLAGQTTGQDNGIYTVNSSGAPTRATDADTSAKVTAGLTVNIEEGTTNSDKIAILTTNNAITLGTTPLVFSLLSIGGSSYTTIDAAGSPLTQRAILNFGTGLSAVDNSGSTRTDVTIDTTLVARHFAVSIGDGSSTSLTVTHNLGTLDVVFDIYRVSDGVEIFCDVTHATTNTITVVFGTAPTTNQYRAVVIG